MENIVEGAHVCELGGQLVKNKGGIGDGGDLAGRRRFFAYDAALNITVLLGDRGNMQESGSLWSCDTRITAMQLYSSTDGGRWRGCNSSLPASGAIFTRCRVHIGAPFRRPATVGPAQRVVSLRLTG